MSFGGTPFRGSPGQSIKRRIDFGDLLGRRKRRRTTDLGPPSPAPKIQDPNIYIDADGDIFVRLTTQAQRRIIPQTIAAIQTANIPLPPYTHGKFDLLTPQQVVAVANIFNITIHGSYPQLDEDEDDGDELDEDNPSYFAWCSTKLRDVTWNWNLGKSFACETDPVTHAVVAWSYAFASLNNTNIFALGALIKAKLLEKGNKYVMDVYKLQTK
ncbi:MAG: hypothetical protein GY928_38180, partial [Colwellia sp.]|nr:hypothetical protein [Colwellia sp.]